MGCFVAVTSHKPRITNTSKSRLVKEHLEVISDHCLEIKTDRYKNILDIQKYVEIVMFEHEIYFLFSYI